MTFDSLRRTVSTALERQTFKESISDKNTRLVNKMITGALLLTTMEQLIKNNSEYSSRCF